MADITIFYSWQSDLDGANTRYFIQSCINAAVRSLKDTICIEADRDTKGEFGSPDISSTIFTKIDQCDIFIADVSITNSEHYEKNDKGEYVRIQKFAPNPNVLLELGYAAGVIGWDNIICIMNEDYGLPSQMPFDLEHRRLTDYSLKNKDKAEIRKEIRNIISDTVMNVMEKGLRPKNGMAAYRIGSYFNSNIIMDLKNYKPTESDYYIKKMLRKKEKCRVLIKMINEIKLIDNEKTDKDNLNLADRLSKPQIKRVKNEDRILYESLINDYVSEQVDDDFWNLGGLQVISQFSNQRTEYIGNDEEKEKMRLIEELQCILIEMNMLSCYWKTFDDYYILPIAICNISSVCDAHISIYIKIEDTSAEVICADRNLINPELKGMEGVIYEYAGLKDILMMINDENISYGENISYSINDNIANARQYFNHSFFGGSLQYDESDYERELQKYFALPMEGQADKFEFYIKSLRPNEKSWIGPALLLKPLKEDVLLSYSIKSDKTDGNISGQLRLHT